MRGGRNQLLLSDVKPYVPVGKATISRWIKTVLARSGIDTNVYSAHSTRAASTSKATSDIPVDHILTLAGWSNADTFAKYYKKQVTQENKFATSVLKM